MKFFFGDKMAIFIVSVKILAQRIHSVQACGVVFKFAAHAAPLVIEVYRFVTCSSEYKITLKLIMHTVRGRKIKKKSKS